MSSHRFTGRREDQRLVTGQGRYTSDWNRDDQVHAFFRRSDRAHATIVSIDTAAARASPNVLAVFTGEDLKNVAFGKSMPLIPPPGRDGQTVKIPERPMMARDRVRFVGEEVALVIATTANAARDAADLIEIEYRDLPPVIGFDAALAADAPRLHENIPGNVCFDFEYGNDADTTAAFARAAGIVEVTLQSPRVAPTPMEPRGTLVSHDAATGCFDIYCASQGGFAFRDELAALANVSPDLLRVHRVDVGGAFGARTSPFPEYPLLMHAARVLKRPVKWLSTRSEDFLTDNHGRAITVRGQLAYDADGRFIGLRTEWLCDSGAYLTSAGVLTNSINGKTIGAGIYHVDAVYGRHRQVMTNTAPTNAYRGAGRPEAVYIVERLVDEAAARLGCDPLTLRLRNAITPKQIPYTTRTGTVLDSGDFPALLKQAKSASDWAGFRSRKTQAARRGKLLGRGCAAFFEPSGGGGVRVDQVAIEFDRSGAIVLYCVAGPSGQGHETVFPDMVENWLGLPRGAVQLRSADPFGPSLQGNPSIGSRSGMLQGSAFKIASNAVIEKARLLAATTLEADPHDVEFDKGQFRIAGTDRTVSLLELIKQHQSDQKHPLDTLAENPVSRAFPAAAHVVEVEIDKTTGTASIVRYTAVDDIGTVLNPTLADGQIVGGIVQGAGHVFGECCLYDPQDGQMLTGSFMDYAMPRAHLLPSVDLLNNPSPTPANLLGAKGVGETGTTGAMSACMNAVIDALRTAGVDHLDMPVTPYRVWQAIHQA